jgi:WD40 domain-containing protein
VNAVAMLADGRAVTAGDDARIALWTPGKQEPDGVLEGHRGSIVALAVSPDAATLASASWDRTIRLWPILGGAPKLLGRAGIRAGEKRRRSRRGGRLIGVKAATHNYRIHPPTEMERLPICSRRSRPINTTPRPRPHYPRRCFPPFDIGFTR